MRPLEVSASSRSPRQPRSKRWSPSGARRPVAIPVPPWPATAPRRRVAAPGRRCAARSGIRSCGGTARSGCFWFPDAALCLVNFNALPAAPGGFLVEQAPLLLTLATERCLAVSGDDDWTRPGLLTVGEPTTRSLPGSCRRPERDGRGDPCGQFQRAQVPALAGNRPRDRTVARLWRPAARTAFTSSSAARPASRTSDSSPVAGGC